MDWGLTVHMAYNSGIILPYQIMVYYLKNCASTLGMSLSSLWFIGEKKGMMFKLKKQGDKWQPRWFVLNQTSLSMFLSKQVSRA